MTSDPAAAEPADPSGASPCDRTASRPVQLPLIVLSAWCGLVSGLFEVAAILVRKQVFDINPFYWISRHFLWLIPLLNLAIFLALGAALSVLMFGLPRRGRWLGNRLLGTMTVLPPIWAGFSRVYGPAGLLLALGIAARLVPWLERHPRGFRRLVRFSFPIAAGLVLIAWASLRGHDRIDAWREAARPLPPPGSPNVLLIVLDTVSAEHLSLHGYDRPTSPTLEELAARGIRFDRAVAPASWTLLSHASMFTGRWPHELSTGYLTPLDGAHRTLAESLGSHGYATAGFVANTSYCGTDSGLARGFTEYRDYQFPRLTAFSTAILVGRPLEKGLVPLVGFLEGRPGLDALAPALENLLFYFLHDRKDAAEVNREFLGWLSDRRQPDRPFFAFLNYFDAHYPYELPGRGLHRFRADPPDPRDLGVMRNWMDLVPQGPSPRQVQFARDSYDDCIAHLDEQVGCLIDELHRRGVLERTWLIIAADHGESFGEHPGVFWHGTSLYRPQVHVPLVIVPPEGGPPPGIVDQTASLRDLPATIVDVLGFRDGSSFPGTSLSRFWDPSSSMASTPTATPEPALSEIVPLSPSLKQDPARWPMAAVTDDAWTYIRHEQTAREELYEARGDPQEQHTLATVPALEPTLDRLRATLSRLTAGPLTPDRFNP